MEQTVPKLLIVEDETTSREYIARAFADLGYEVRVAASGREAIDVGSRFRPDVLVADWMLRNHFHGLDVSEVLGQIRPDLRTILVTGFPSRDLVEDAERARIFRFLQKPFGLDDLEDAVQAALDEPHEPGPAPALGIVHVERDGTILFANQRARHLFSYTHVGSGARHLSDILPPAVVGDLDRAVREWVSLRPLANSSVKWMIRAGQPGEDGSRMLVVRNRRDHIVDQPRVVQALLEVEDGTSPRWPYRGAVLVVDAERAVRRTAVRLLRNASATCYGVASPAEALRILRQDRSIRYAVIDYGSGNESLADTLDVLARERPDLCVVGTAPENREDEFADLGVPRFVLKPWALRGLIHAAREDARNGV